MTEQMQADYVRTARAKDLPKYRVVFKHALKNAFLPVLSKDLILIMGVTLVYSAMLITFNLAVDVLYAWVDPRIDVAGA